MGMAPNGLQLIYQPGGWKAKPANLADSGCFSHKTVTQPTTVRDGESSPAKASILTTLMLPTHRQLDRRALTFIGRHSTLHWEVCGIRLWRHVPVALASETPSQRRSIGCTVRRSAEADVDVWQQRFQTLLPVSPHEHIVKLQPNNNSIYMSWHKLQHYSTLNYINCNNNNNNNNKFLLWCNNLIPFCCTMVLLMTTSQSWVHYQTNFCNSLCNFLRHQGFRCKKKINCTVQQSWGLYRATALEEY